MRRASRGNPASIMAPPTSQPEVGRVVGQSCSGIGECRSEIGSRPRSSCGIGSDQCAGGRHARPLTELVGEMRAVPLQQIVGRAGPIHGHAVDGGLDLVGRQGGVASRRPPTRTTQLLPKASYAMFPDLSLRGLPVAVDPNIQVRGNAKCLPRP